MTTKKKASAADRIRALESKLYRANATNAALRRRIRELENSPWREELSETLDDWRFKTKEQFDEGFRTIVDALRLLRLESEHARAAAPAPGPNGAG